jgi:hypothetical protein
MSARLRRRSASTEHAADEGPFVSFTDLAIGIIFLFLILVAALMLIHQEAMQKAEAEARAFRLHIAQLQAQLDAIAALDAEHPPFRLAIVYNSFQRQLGESEWTFSRTVQVFRSPNGLCLDNVLLRSNLSTAWKPPVNIENVPTAANQDYVRKGEACTLSAAGERWNSQSETGSVRRAGANLYSGASVLHKKDGDVTVEIQYRVLGVYDDYFRNAQPSPTGPQSTRL